MVIKQSELIIENFLVLNCSFAFNPKAATAKNMDDNNINIKFDILKTRRKENFKLILQISSNIDLKGPNYGFSVLTESEFSFMEFDKKEKHIIDNYLMHSALPIAINLIRGYLATISGPFPLGKYILPSIDLKYLIESKQKSFEEKKKKPLLKR